jgi:transposase
VVGAPEVVHDGQVAAPGGPRAQAQERPRVVLTDAQWARVAPLLPPCDRRRGGRPPRAPRPIVAALLWIARTGAAWRELPAVYGAWISPYRYHRRWTENGLWPRILQALQEGEAEM